jgi:predicted PurR-regulated permease PerM
MTNAVTQARQPPSFLRVMLFLAATIVVLAGMRLGAPVVTPTLFALVVSLMITRPATDPPVPIVEVKRTG